MENQVFKKLEGRTAGVQHWMFFRHEFQHIFSSKIATKALDRDLDIV